MITALRTTLKSLTLNTDFAATTAVKPATTQPTAPTLSGDKLRTMLSASRATGDPVLVADGSVSTSANSAKSISDFLKEIASRVKIISDFQKRLRDEIQKAPVRTR